MRCGDWPLLVYTESKERRNKILKSEINAANLYLPLAHNSFVILEQWNDPKVGVNLCM